jgi:hypothetical protein
MILARTAFALIAAAAALNGSVALATSLPGCAVAPVCALPLEAPAQFVPASLAGGEEPSLAEVAPPRRPADLTAPRAFAPQVFDDEPSRAAFAPPRRPEWLTGPRADAGAASGAGGAIVEIAANGRRLPPPRSRAL